MRYYVIEALTPVEGEEERTMLGFDSLDTARVQYHSDLAEAIASPLTSKVTNMLVDERGRTHERSYWPDSRE